MIVVKVTSRPARSPWHDREWMKPAAQVAAPESVKAVMAGVEEGETRVVATTRVADRVVAALAAATMMLIPVVSRTIFWISWMSSMPLHEGKASQECLWR